MSIPSMGPLSLVHGFIKNGMKLTLRFLSLFSSTSREFDSIWKGTFIRFGKDFIHTSFIPHSYLIRTNSIIKGSW